MLRSLFIGLFLLISGFGYCQDIDALNANLRASEREIERLEGVLKENRSKQNDKIAQKRLLDAKVVQREKLVRQLDERIDHLERDMGSLSGVVREHNRRYDSLMEVRSRMIFGAYKVLCSRHLSGVGDVRERFLKIELQKVERALGREAANVDSMKRVMGGRYEGLMAQSREVARLVVSRKDELDALQDERREVEVLNKQLKSEESVLRQNADSERVKMQNLQSQIEQLIKRESAKGEVVLVGGEFASNKGRLPAPLVAFVVDEAYGLHNHPTNNTIKVRNNGVNLRATLDLSVSAVFEGEVRGVFLVDGMGSSVLVRHGEFFTVYSNLQRVTVARGQVLRVGQQVGLLAENARVLHFEIWKGTKTLDPMLWIRSSR